MVNILNIGFKIMSSLFMIAIGSAHDTFENTGQFIISVMITLIFFRQCWADVANKI